MSWVSQKVVYCTMLALDGYPSHSDRSLTSVHICSMTFYTWQNCWHYLLPFTDIIASIWQPHLFPSELTCRWSYHWIISMCSAIFHMHHDLSPVLQLLSLWRERCRMSGKQDNGNPKRRQGATQNNRGATWGILYLRDDSAPPFLTSMIISRKDTLTSGNVLKLSTTLRSLLISSICYYMAFILATSVLEQGSILTS